MYKIMLSEVKVKVSQNKTILIKYRFLKNLLEYSSKILGLLSTAEHKPTIFPSSILEVTNFFPIWYLQQPWKCNKLVKNRI